MEPCWKSTTYMSYVPGHPKWLEYPFNGYTDTLGKPPASDEGNDGDDGKPWVNVNKENPWDGEEGY